MGIQNRLLVVIFVPMVSYQEIRIGCIIVLLLLLGYQPLHSQKSWTGGAGTFEWFNAGNWSPAGVPTKDDVVTIDLLNALIEINPISVLDTAFAKAIVIEEMDKISVVGDRVLSIDSEGSENISVHVKDGTFSIIGDAYISGSIVEGIKLENEASFVVNVDASLHLLDFANNVSGRGINVSEGCLLGNNGHITIRGGGTTGKKGILNEGEILNTGLLEIDDLQGNTNFHGIENYHLFSNTGIIRIDSIPNSSDFFASSDEAIVRNTGTIETTAILNTDRPGVNITNGATLRGSGIINSHLLKVSQNGSILQPDFGIGSFTINGDLFVGISANWNLRIGGIDGPNSFTGHAQVILNGDLTLEDNATTGPEFHVLLENGFVPNELDNFTFLDFSGTREGDFDDDIVQPSSQDEWGVFEVAEELVYRKPCAVPNSIASCAGTFCPLYTGAISGDGSVVLNGSYEVQSGEQYDIIFPETELNGGFTVNTGTVLNVTPGSCSF